MMFKFFWVFLNDQYLTCVKATSTEDAINQAYMKHGSASKYTGHGRDNFKAVQVSLA